MSSPSKHAPIAAAAAALAWLVPGAGHFYLGRRTRGLVIFILIALTFWSGVAVGGVLTVDSRYERWWFLAQMFTGVHGVSSWYRQERLYDRIAKEENEGVPVGPVLPNGGPSITPQQAEVDTVKARLGVALVSPTDNVARAFSGVAGLLNLMCIFDALVLGLLGARGEPQEPAAEPSAKAGPSPRRRREDRQS